MPQNKTSEFFNRYAHDFSDIYGNKNTFPNSFINNCFRKAMKYRYSKSVNSCYPIEGKSVLDVGCGPGHYSVELAKRGAKYILGIDFSEEMINLAMEKSKLAQVENRCVFVFGDFLECDITEKFDYSIVMGFMDYVEKPIEIIGKVLSVTKLKAFFSFPIDAGILAWQRKLHYRRRCDLYMYNIDYLHLLFDGMKYNKMEIEKSGREFFVTVLIA